VPSHSNRLSVVTLSASAPSLRLRLVGQLGWWAMLAKKRDKRLNDAYKTAGTESGTQVSKWMSVCTYMQMYMGTAPLPCTFASPSSGNM
jgi:hypothetical protein